MPLFPNDYVNYSYLTLLYLTYYRAFINLLKAEGSLHVMSEPMRKLLNIMPEEARLLVQKEGGLRDFLAKSSLFTIEANVVTNFEDKFITDLCKPYKKPQDPPIITPKENDIGMLEKIPGPDTFSFNTTPGKFGPVGSLVTNVGDNLQQNNSLASVGDSLRLNNNSKIDFPLPNFSGAQSLENLGNYGNVNSENVNSYTMTDTWSGQGRDLDKWANVEEFVPLVKDVNIVNTVQISDKESTATGGNEITEIEEKSTKDTETCKETPDNSANDLDKEISENINKILSDDDSDDVEGLVDELTDKATKMAEENSVIELKKDETDVKSSVDKMSSELSHNIAVIGESKKEFQDTVDIKITNTEPAVSGLPDENVGENKNNKKTNEQNEVTINPIPNIGTKENAVSVEPKLTKEKGVQSKPSTKTKIIMTEAMNEPYKAEYEKLLRSCQGWEGKYQELLDKNIQMEKKYGTDVVSLEKKLKDCGHKIEVGNSLFSCKKN